MKVFWATLLLCGLLPISQSIVKTSGSATVQLPKKYLEKRLQEEVAKADPVKDLIGKTLGDIGNQNLLANLGCSGKGALEASLGNNQGNDVLGRQREIICNLLKGLIFDVKVLDLSIQNTTNGLRLTLKLNVAVDAKVFGTSLVNMSAIIMGNLQLLQNEAGAPVAKLVNCHVQVTTDLRLVSGQLNLNPVNDFLNKALENQLCGIMTDVEGALIYILNKETFGKS